MAKGELPGIGARIRTARKAKGLTLEQLAAKVPGEVHFTTIARMERSTQTISTDWLVRIAHALDTTPSELLGEPVPVKSRMVPLIGSIAAGNWREAIENPEALLPAFDVGPNTFALRPVGDSMDQLAPEGSIAMVDPDDRELRDGKLYAVMNDGGESTFKRFRSEPPRLEPVSSNPEHKAIALGLEPFTVIGKVVQIVIHP